MTKMGGSQESVNTHNRRPVYHHKTNRQQPVYEPGIIPEFIKKLIARDKDNQAFLFLGMLKFFFNIVSQGQFFFEGEMGNHLFSTFSLDVLWSGKRGGVRFLTYTLLKIKSLKRAPLNL